MYKSGDINPEILRRWIHMPGITAIDFDANTTTVAASSFRTMVCLFNFDPRKRTLLMAGNDMALSDVCFNKEATFIATCGANTIAQVFEAPRSGGSGYSEYNCHFRNVNSVDFSNDSSFLLTASADHYVRIIDLQRRVPVLNFTGHLHVVRCARFFNVNSFFASCGDDRVVNIWDSRVNRLTNFFLMNERVTKVAISPSDCMVAAVTAKGIAMFDTRVSKCLQQYFPEKDEYFVSASFHAEKPWALMGQSNGTIIVADVFAGSPVFEMSHLMAKLTDAKFSKCGKYFAVSGKDPQSQVSLYAVKREQKPFYICEDSASATHKSVYYKCNAAHPERKGEIKASNMSNQPNWRPRKWSKTKQRSHSLEMFPRVANKRNEDLIVMSQKKELVVRTTGTKLDCTPPPPLGVLVRAKSNSFESVFPALFSNSNSGSVEPKSESTVTGLKADGSNPILDIKAAAQALIAREYAGPDSNVTTKMSILSKTGSRKADSSTSTSEIIAAAQTGITREDAGQVAGSNFKSLANVSIFTKAAGKKRDSSILTLDKKAAARAVIAKEEDDQPVGLDFESTTKAAIVSEDEGNRLVDQLSLQESREEIQDEFDKPTTSKSAFNTGLTTESEEKAEQERKNIYGEIQELCERHSTYLESSYYSEEVLSHQIQRIMRQLESDNLTNKTTETLQNLRKFFIKLGTFLKVYDSEMENYAIALADEVDKLECD